MIRLKNYDNECGIFMQGFKDRGNELPITRWRLYFKLYLNDADRIEMLLDNANTGLTFEYINPIDISFDSMRYLIKLINKYDDDYDIKLSIMKDRIVVTHHEPDLDDSLTYLKSLPILNQEDNKDMGVDEKGVHMEFIVNSKEFLSEYKKSMELR